MVLTQAPGVGPEVLQVKTSDAPAAGVVVAPRYNIELLPVKLIALTPCMIGWSGIMTD
jgi:hypothetical protein